MKLFQYSIICLFLIITLFTAQIHVYAQTFDQGRMDSPTKATSSADASQSAKPTAQPTPSTNTGDVTRVEGQQNKEYMTLFAKRRVSHPSLTNFMAYSIQYAVRKGVPANTVVLIMLVPLLATLVLFFRHVVGVPSLAMILPIALAITLVATGLTAGLILLFTIIFASTVSRLILRRIRIVQLSKITLTMLVVSAAIIATLTITTEFGVLAVRQISIFPILLLILLSQNIIELQTDRSFSEILQISTITISLGILGYFILASDVIRNFVMVYPEVMLLLLPVNVIIGRYFGLRFTEYIRFSSVK